MGIEALYRRPRTTKPEPAQDPSLPAAWARGHAAESVSGDGHHVHSDGEGLRLSRVVLDSFSRRVLAWRVSITEIGGIVLCETLRRRRRRTASRRSLEHRSQAAVTCEAFTDVLTATTIRHQHGRQGRCGTTCSSNTVTTVKQEVYLCVPTIASRTASTLRSRAISISTIAAARIRPYNMTPIKPTSSSDHAAPSASQPNPAEAPPHRSGKTVRTTGATSLPLQNQVTSTSIVAAIVSVARRRDELCLTRRSHAVHSDKSITVANCR